MSIPSSTELTNLLPSFESHKPSAPTKAPLLNGSTEAVRQELNPTVLKTQQLSHLIQIRTSTPNQTNEDLKPKLTKLQNGLAEYQANNLEEMETGALRNFPPSYYHTFPLPHTNVLYMMNETFSPRKHCRIYFAASMCYLLFLALILFGAYRQKMLRL
ncbi:MAG: hypothetical protein CK425_06685 [Parachlamydia sp.]|nr:MAG: hypothetical protein CK425_06685 [Parachlamydia sp.]